METSTIQADARSAYGKGVARKLRRAGKIPAVVYGGGHEPATLALAPEQLVRLRKGKLGWNTPVTISVEGGDDVGLAMLREVQKHPLSGNLLHADFLRVDETVKVEVRVPLEVVGRSVGESLGGRMRRPVRDIMVRCLPKDIPHSIVIDVTPLNIDDKVWNDELPTPDGVEVVFRRRAPVLLIAGRRGGKPAAGGAGGEGGEGAEA